MTKIISFTLLVGLVLTFCFLIPKKTFSQTIHRKDTTTASTKPGEGSSSTYVKGITPMRARALAGAVLGLTSLVIGWRAKRRASAGIGNKGRKGAMVALALGAIAIVLSLIHLFLTAGAVFGSGSGKAGAIFALPLGLIGIILSTLVLRQKKV